MSGADAVCMQQPCRSDHSFECALAMARPKARTAIERGLLGGESGYMCTNCISRILVILLLGVYMVGCRADAVGSDAGEVGGTCQGPEGACE